MNVARSTFVRRGYPLTALAVAVLLLAASSGTAWAQTIGFSSSRGTLEEGASADNATPAPLTVTISRRGNFDKDDGNSATDDDLTFEDWVEQNNTDHLMIEAEYEGSAGGSSSEAFPFKFMWRSGVETTSLPVIPGQTKFGFKEEASRSDGVAIRIELTITNVYGSNDTNGADNDDWNDGHDPIQWTVSLS